MTGAFTPILAQPVEVKLSRKIRLALLLVRVELHELSASEILPLEKLFEWYELQLFITPVMSVSDSI